MIILVQVIQNFQYQKLPSIIVTIESQKYVINVFDGFQRYRNDQNYGITKSPHYFFTQLKAETIGGFFGQCINTFTGPAFQSKIYGPKNTVQFFENLRQQIIVGQYMLPFSAYEFLKNKCMLGINDMKTFQQFSKNPQYDENSEKNEQINEEKLEHTCDNKAGAMYNKEKRHTDYIKQNLKPQQINDASKFIKNNEYYQDQNTKIIPIPLFNNSNMLNSDIILSYIFVVNERKEKFNRDLLAKLIPKSKHGELFKKGEITINDKTYTKQDFLEEQQPSPVIIIIDCPEIEYIDALVNNLELTAFYQNNIDKKQYVSLIVHTSQKNVISNENYQKLIQKFGDQADHIFSDPCLNEQDLDQNIINTQAKQFKNKGFVEQLHGKFPKFFPNFKIMDDFAINQKVYELNNNPQKNELNIQNIMKPFIPVDNIYLAKKYFQFKIIPQQITKNTKYTHFSHFKVDETVPIEYNQEFQETYQNYLQKYKKESQNLNQQQLFLEVVFLGTASMMPAQYRNVSCILLRKENVNIIFDCGEGSYGQFYERFNYNQYQIDNNILEKELMKLKYIVITHHHEDHFIGTINFLKYRQQILGEKASDIFVIVSSNVYPFFRNYLNLIEQFKNLKIVLTQFINQNQQSFEFEDFLYDLNYQSYQQQQQNQSMLEQQYKKDFQELQQNVKIFQESSNIDQIQLQFCQVIHCAQSYGVLVKYTDTQQSVSYSGDTRPCEQFIELSKNCDLMIHEATFSSDLVKNAQQNMHSTVLEALDSAIKANSKYLALTHFSQRYSKKAQIEKFENQEYQKYFNENTVYAFDHLGFNITDLDEVVMASQACLKIGCEE